MPLTVKSPALIEAGSIGWENVKENVVGGVPVTTDPAAGSLETTVGTIAKWEIQVAQLAGTPESQRVAYSAPPQNVPGTGIDGDAVVIAPGEGEGGISRRPGLRQRGRLHHTRPDPPGCGR